MIFTKRNNPTDFDIPIALVETREFLSGDFIHVIDFSQNIDGNQISESDAVFLFNTTRGTNLGKLIGSPRQADLLITNEYYTDKGSGNRIPLWYRHQVTQCYNNPNVQKRTVTLRSTGGYKVKNIVGDNELLVRYFTSSDVQRVPIMTGGTPGTVTNVILDDISIDYGTRSITVSPHILVGAGEESVTFIVTYRVIPNLIKVTGNELVPYVIEVIPTSSDSDNYLLSIISNTNKFYSVEYQYITSNGSIDIINDKTIAVPLFTKGSKSLVSSVDVASADITMLRMYANEVESNVTVVYVPTNADGGEVSNIHLSRFPDIMYAVKPMVARSTAIKLTAPQWNSIDDDWFPLMAPGHINNGTNEYSLPNTGTSTSGIRYRTEKAVIISSTTIRIYSDNILTTRDINDEWTNITVQYRIDKRPILITYVDTTTGIITLAESINTNDTIDVSYQTRFEGFPVTNICVNPLHTHYTFNVDNDTVEEYTVSDNIFLYLLIKDTVVKNNINVFVKILPRYSYGEPIHYTYDNIDELLNAPDDSGTTWGSTRIEYRENIVNFANIHDGVTTGKELLVGDPLDSEDWDDIRIEPIALVYIDSPSDEDGFIITDATVYGGGLLEPEGTCYDYSRYDGEITDLSVFLHITIDSTLRDNMETLAKLWDPITVLAENQNQTAELVTQSLIEKKVNKFSIYGTETEIIYNDE